MHLLYLIPLLFAGYLTFTVLALAALAIAGRLGRPDDDNVPTADPVLRKIGVLIPAYKEDAVIVDSVRVNLSQQYPADRFDLIVIADSLGPGVLAQLAALPIRVIEVQFQTSTVAKAINTALTQIPTDAYDILVVADADNHLAPDFLSRINAAFGRGWRAVQGHRIAKNTDTGVALLDAVSEEINNHLFRRGSRALGLSSSIIGSGMAIEPALMKKAMSNLVTMGGYDKELEMNVVLNGHTVGYLEGAFIYDEKVASRAVFEHQRTRWIAAQWQFLTAYFRRGLGELRHGRLGAPAKIVQALILPKVLLLGVLTVSTVLGLLSSHPIGWVVPLVLLLVLGLSLLISVPAYLRKRITVRELLLIPVLMISFGRAVLNIRKAFKSFMHTPHSAATDALGQPANAPADGL